MNKSLNILIAPLDWGLGHASRCVPIIELLLKNNCNVIIAADKLPLKFLREKFPRLNFVHLKGYNINYGKKFVALKVFFQLPKILFSIVNEHFWLHRIIKEKNITAVISDNRFGLWSKDAYTVFITHQIKIKLPKAFRIFEWPLYKLNVFAIEKFNECWIPDYEGTPNLTGELSHLRKPPKNSKFIHPLSLFRFNSGVLKRSNKFTYEVLFILSGPEPQRTLLEEKILQQLNQSPVRACLVRGTTNQTFVNSNSKNVKVIPFASSDKLLELISQSKVLICRAGYTTIMDLITLNLPAILVPTPGQTEQEYIAEHLSGISFFSFEKQKNFNLEKAIKNFRPQKSPFKKEEKKLEITIEEFIKKIGD